MKRVIGCRAGVLVVSGWLLLSLIGYIGKDSIYAGYALDWRTTPYFQLVFQGMHDGIYPWSRDADGNTLFAAADRTAEGETLEELPGCGPEGGTLAEASGIGSEEGIRTESTGIGPEGGTLAEAPGTGLEEGTLTQAPEGGGEKGDLAAAGGGKPAGGGPGAESAAPAGEAKSFVQVDRAYFDDAVFIGDSRTVGLMEYGGLDQAAFYATVGMNVHDLWEKEFCEVDGEKVTLEQALSSRRFGKIYFQMGINEMGRGTVDSFLEVYADIIRRFRELQPDAVIFIQGIMRVSKEKSESDAIFNNAGIDERNERIAQLADNVHVFYVDVNEIVSDAEGNLDASLTSDGLHLYAAEYAKWVEYLMTRGIEP